MVFSFIAILDLAPLRNSEGKKNCECFQNVNRESNMLSFGISQPKFPIDHN